MIPLTLISDNIDDLYKKSIVEILSQYSIVEARGLKFKEVLFPHLILTNPRARIIQNSARKISKKFMMAEFIWIMSGSEDVEMISHYNKNIVQFSDDEKVFHGAYGPRLRMWEYTENYDHKYYDQLSGCLEKLKNDHGTRQAVMIILNPGIDFTVKTKDIPCNDLLQFFIRDNKLHMSCYVRSNDLNWGFPYDVFHWTMLQELYAGILGVELGEYHHIAGSFHIYDKDLEKMDLISRCQVNQIEMPKMPKYTDLHILTTLNNFEKEIRIYQKPIIKVFDSYWTELLSWL